MKRLVGGMMLAFALACGGMDVSEGEAPVGDPGAATGVTEPAPSAAPVAAAPASAGGGQFPATAEGVCRLQESCGCSNETYAACLQGMAQTAPEIYSCIVANDCASFCSGGALRCVESWYATQSQLSRQQHEQQMEMIRNRPSGTFGGCSPGQTEIVDQNGNLIRCQ